MPFHIYSSFDLNQNWFLVSIGFVLFVVLIAFKKQVSDLVNQQLTSVRRNESKLLEVTSAISGEIQLIPLLEKVIQSVTDILEADRSTLFLHDPKTNELWSQVAEGINTRIIRFPSNMGIAGSVFTSGETINIKDAYADDRFNKAVDKKTGYRTRSILCMQICNKSGQAIGVIQVLNKANKGIFKRIDEDRLRAFSAQAAIAIENAQLFNEVITIKNYTESMIESMSSGIMSTNEDGIVIRANSTAATLLGKNDIDSLLGVDINVLFKAQNEWIATSAFKAIQEGISDEALDVNLVVGEGLSININLKTQSLSNFEGEKIGCLLVFEDITEEKRLRSTMARYMTKELADKLLAEGEQALGGSLQEATIIFSDIRSFTSFSERNGPQETVIMLNEYFSEMFDCIKDNGGILDKYIGDAIMAVFGAPFQTPLDADNAVKAAVEMISRLREFNKARKQAQKEPIEIGIGVNTDQVVSGNIGSSKRMDYTVIGDGVNLAARLEGATKHYQTPVLLSESTLKALKEPIAARVVDRIKVKGKDEPVVIYEAVGALELEKQEHVKITLDMYNEAIASYQDQKWQKAQETFTRVLEIDPDDHLTKMYLLRCARFKENPPGENWDGVWTMQSK